MAEKRVIELARELDFNKQELVNKINELDLGITVNNVMTRLTSDEVDKVKRALKSSASKAKPKKTKPKKAAPAAAADTASAEGVTVLKRRSSSKSRKDKEDEGSEAAAASPSDALGPVIRRPKRRRTVVSLDENNATEVTTEVVAAEAPAEPLDIAGSETISAAAPVEEPEVAAAEPAVEVEASAEAEAPASEPVEEVVAASDAAPEQVQEPAAESSDEPAVTEEVAAQPEAASGQAAPAEPAAASEGEHPRTPSVRRGTLASAAKPAATKVAEKASEGGAQVLGRIDLSDMQQRLDGRNFEPAGAAGKREDGNRRNAGRGRREAFTPSNDFGGRGGGGRGRSGRKVVNQRDLYDGGGRKRRRKEKQQAKPKKTEITTAAEHKRVVRIEDAITVGDLGRQMGVKAGQIAFKLMESGMMANVNTTIDFETAQLIALEFGYTVENVAFDITQFYDTEPDPDEKMSTRPPVVTVMGHVDHGKTSLLDAIRASSVTSSEAGGITQHIGAYTVDTEDGRAVTFLDTPGHEAFTALRARGAQATDIVVLVVAADDGVMPQTVEAINHSKDAGVPIIVAVNKIDKPSANPDRIRTALSEFELLPEGWGGSTPFVDVSALQHTNISDLVEYILLQAEVEELKANPDREAQGLVIESELDTGRGPLATVLVQRGTLKKGDIVVVGEHYGRVRTMSDYRGDDLATAGPSIPVEITGLSGVPEAGDPFFVVENEQNAKSITDHVFEVNRKERMASLSKTGMEKLQLILDQQAGHKKLKLIVKADVQGSIEAIKQSFAKLGNEEVSVDVIHAAVGGVTENDVNLAAATSDSAIAIIGFNVRPDNRASEVAEKYGIQIFSYSVIYDAIEQTRQLLEGMLDPLETENVLGQAEVRQTFSAPKIGTIAGCYVTSGVLKRGARARLLRNGTVIYDSALASLRRFKDDVREVKSGFECGTSLENYNDIKVGDVIEAYEIEEVAATL